MKRALVVGSGAGGATVARELQGKFQVEILEAGSSFRPFTANLRLIEKVKRTGLLFDERQIRWLFPPMNIAKTKEGMVLVRGIGEGGTTTLSAGNAVRQDQDLKALGIDLDKEFEQLSREIPIHSSHQKLWHAATRAAFSICQGLGLNPRPTPKMINPDLCAGCGRCVLGCPRGAKWDSRIYLKEALDKGARLLSGRRAQKVVLEKGRVTGVLAVRGLRSTFYPADLVVLAAGGLGTPRILQSSGFQCRPQLFVDPVLCVAAPLDRPLQNREMTMPFIVQKNHFILSPYFDFLSFFFNRRWKYPASGIYSLMIKLADTNSGTVSGSGVRKSLDDIDQARLREGVDLCKQVLIQMGVKNKDIFLGTLNAGHPGGMLPLTQKDSVTLHSASLPPNLYVADASLFPNSLGNPPILTIAALAKAISRRCAEYS
jgi:choline dehydrogenase-like flavoprotein